MSRPGPKPRPILDRFMTKFEPEPMSGCWLWLHSHVQGRANFDAKPAAWTAYDLFGAGSRVGRWVLHKCDNMSCVNPAHLYLGDLMDNIRDCMRRGRNSRGERHRSAKLSASDVRDLRQARKDGVPQSVLCRRYGIVQSAVSNIEHGRRWKHLLVPDLPHVV